MDGRATRRFIGATALLVVTSFSLVCLGTLAVVAQARAAPTAQDAAQGKTIFANKCAGCHSIGGGKLVGPDLKGVTAIRPHDWLVEFIVAPDQVIARGDPTAKQLVQEYGGISMPNLGLTKAQAQDVLAHIQEQSGAAASAPAAAPVAAGSAVVGRDLFSGDRRFANGGPSCIACHNVAGAGGLEGGTWGLDLTHAYSKFEAQGVTSFMQAPPFPGMTEAFLTRPLTPQEIADVTAYLAETDTLPATAASGGWIFLVVGLAAFGVLAGLAQLIWRGRLQGVRKPLLRGMGALEGQGSLGSHGKLPAKDALGGQSR